MVVYRAIDNHLVALAQIPENSGRICTLTKNSYTLVDQSRTTIAINDGGKKNIRYARTSRTKNQTVLSRIGHQAFRSDVASFIDDIPQDKRSFSLKSQRQRGATTAADGVTSRYRDAWRVGQLEFNWRRLAAANAIGGNGINRGSP